MDLIGEEKRIQALFHEIKAQDEQLAPPFPRTWNMVEGRFSYTRRQPVFLRAALTFPRFITAALVISSLGTVIVIRPWRLLRQPPRDASASLRNVAPAFEAGTKPTSEANTPRQPKLQKRKQSTAVVHRFTGKRMLARTSFRKHKNIELSRWQSPTAGLLRFPGDDLLKNGPKVIQSAQDMRTFLANLN